ncbi:hypothetical protein [Amycolatopsis sp. NPDC049868]|uniref:hypothetical protein n=1 Tax=Amycolatopsis sp. NPDC049868 TaxID=3363934 RepID=UPI00379A8FB1
MWNDVDRPVALDRIVRTILSGQLVPCPRNRYGGHPWWWGRADERRHAERIGTDVDPAPIRRRPWDNVD